MKSYCPKCHSQADYIDLDSGSCESCLVDHFMDRARDELGEESSWEDRSTWALERVRKARMVSVQTAAGISRRVVAMVQEQQRRASQGGGNRA